MFKGKPAILLVDFLAILVFGLQGLAVFLPPTSGVTKSNFERLKTGMSRDEVNRILGTLGFLENVNNHEYCWSGPDGACALCFDDASRLSERRWIDFPRSNWQKLTDCILLENRRIDRPPRLLDF